MKMKKRCLVSNCRDGKRYCLVSFLCWLFSCKCCYANNTRMIVRVMKNLQIACLINNKTLDVQFVFVFLVNKKNNAFPHMSKRK